MGKEERERERGYREKEREGKRKREGESIHEVSVNLITIPHDIVLRLGVEIH